MSDALFEQLKGMLGGDHDLATQVHGLLGGGAGGLDIGGLLAGLQANPALLGQLSAKLGPNPLAALMGVLPGRAAAAGAGGADGGQGGLDLGALGGMLSGLTGGQAAQAGQAGHTGPDLGAIEGALGGLLGKK